MKGQKLQTPTLPAALARKDVLGKKRGREAEPFFKANRVQFDDFFFFKWSLVPARRGGESGLVQLAILCTDHLLGGGRGCRHSAGGALCGGEIV